MLACCRDAAFNGPFCCDEALIRTSPQSLPSIGAEVGVSNGIAAILVDALEQLGLARRFEAQNDWGGRLVSLSIASADYRKLHGISNDLKR